jgi:hypothetical protein
MTPGVARVRMRLLCGFASAFAYLAIMFGTFNAFYWLVIDCDWPTGSRSGGVDPDACPIVTLPGDRRWRF